MNLKLVFFTLSNLLLATAIALLVPLGVSICYRSQGHGDWIVFLVSSGGTALSGIILNLLTRKSDREMGNREAFAIVSLSWVVIALVGSMPYFLYQDFLGSGIDQKVSAFRRFTDSYFESMSGFSTTGATILTEIEHLPHGILFWRSFTHWFGGMGILVLAVAILPLLGVGGMQLLRAEAPGPQTDRLTPRIQETAKVLWWVYVLITLVEVIFLWVGSVWIVPEEVRESPADGLFYAFCHAFGTMATGGFSPKNASIGHYQSVYIDTIIIIFMFIAGTNFSLHYRALQGNVGSYWKDEEFRFYVFVIGTVTTVLVLCTMLQPVVSINGTVRAVNQEEVIEIDDQIYPIVDGKVLYENQFHSIINEHATINGQIYPIYKSDVVYNSIGSAIRYVLFQVLAIVTTTGYGTADFELWPYLAQIMLIFLMFFGGSAGSTGGGMKQVRFLLLIKQSYREIKHMILPHAVLPIKLNEKIVPKDIMSNILGFFFIGVAVFVLATISLTGLGLDLTSASTSVASALMNIGPGLGTVGPTDNYAHILPVGKWVLCFCMLMGRLELYTLLVILTPMAWRK